jgi:hypothetical protein
VDSEPLALMMAMNSPGALDRHAARRTSTKHCGGAAEPGLMIGSMQASVIVIPTRDTSKTAPWLAVTNDSASRSGIARRTVTAVWTLSHRASAGAVRLTPRPGSYTGPGDQLVYPVGSRGCHRVRGGETRQASGPNAAAWIGTRSPVDISPTNHIVVQ